MTEEVKVNDTPAENDLSEAQGTDIAVAGEDLQCIQVDLDEEDYETVWPPSPVVIVASGWRRVTAPMAPIRVLKPARVKKLTE